MVCCRRERRTADPRESFGVSHRAPGEPGKVLEGCGGRGVGHLRASALTAVTGAGSR